MHAGRRALLLPFSEARFESVRGALGHLCAQSIHVHWRGSHLCSTQGRGPRTEVLRRATSILLKGNIEAALLQLCLEDLVRTCLGMRWRARRRGTRRRRSLTLFLEADCDLRKGFHELVFQAPTRNIPLIQQFNDVALAVRGYFYQQIVLVGRIHIRRFFFLKSKIKI